ncbi:MAG: hypothetical protein JSS49_00240 [Planctomycetes bacterium]|nr:hypothetical protein [Planctomycetota bacterium]
MTFSRFAVIVLLSSLLLTALFWGPLWVGYGFIGGDLYPYFFPQKAFLADRLHAGEFPLWNNLTGFGYPVLGESQTGAAYPPYLFAYYFLNINTAYNLQHLLHYVVCFVGLTLFARRIGMGTASALLSAIVFTYGWFPPRACLEWAIVTGAWLPIALWCVESFVQTRWWRYAIGLSLVLGLQLLAGHFHLAFITQLLVLAYAVWRIRFTDERTAEKLLIPAGDKSVTKVTGVRSLLMPLVLAIMAGFLIAAVQLIPAWELKTRSSRANVGKEHDPSYGHLPPLYASQMIAPWLWYSPLAIDGDDAIRNFAEFGAPWHWFGPQRDLDESLMHARAGGLTSIATNKVEAHLYCGLIPLALAAWWLCLGRRQTVSSRLRPLDRRPANPAVAAFPLTAECWFWGIAAGLALIYATGWLLPVARFIPGFNFFRGPGRYGIVTTLSVAILAGRGLDQLLRNKPTVGRIAIVGGVLCSTVCDLWMVSRMVTYAVMVSRPPVSLRDQSPVRKLLLDEEFAPRLYAPGQNLGNLLGISCLPVYLGIAPASYSDPRFAGEGMPKADASQHPVPADANFSQWLRDSGVTHLLSFDRLDETSWNSKLIWQGIDPLLNFAWGRREPLFLYKLTDARGRASVLESPGGVATVALQQTANQLIVQSQSDQSATLLLRELHYPGWTVEVDGQAAVASHRGTFRQVPILAGSHTVIWTYRPRSVKLGLNISLATLLVLAAIGHVRFWHRGWLDRMLNR